MDLAYVQSGKQQLDQELTYWYIRIFSFLFWK